MKIYFIILFSCFGNVLFAEMPIELILERFENHMSINKHFHSITIEELHFSGVSEPKFSALNENFITDGSQSKWQLRNWIELSSPEDIETFTIENKKLDWKKTVIWNNELFIEHRPRKKLDSDYVYASENIDQYKKHLALSYLGSSLEGFVKGDLKSFVDIFRSDIDNVLIKNANMKISGKETECLLLSLSNDNGLLNVWLSPEYDYNICRMESVKSQGQTVYGERLPIKLQQSPEDFDESIRPYIPTGDMAKVSFVLSDVDFQNIDGKWIATEGTHKTTTTYTDGKVKTEIHTHKRTSIDLSPDLTEAFISNIKNGSRVYFDSPIEIVMQHFWEDGKIIPKVEEHIEEIIDKEIEEHVNVKDIDTGDNSLSLSSGNIAVKGKNIKNNIPENTYIPKNKMIRNYKYYYILITSIVIIILLGIFFLMIKKMKNKKKQKSFVLIFNNMGEIKGSDTFFV